MGGLFTRVVPVRPSAGSEAPVSRRTPGADGGVGGYTRNVVPADRVNLDMGRFSRRRPRGDAGGAFAAGNGWSRLGVPPLPRPAVSVPFSPFQIRPVAVTRSSAGREKNPKYAATAARTACSQTSCP